MHPDTEVTQVAINHWPEGERPREKLLNRGRGALSDAEILAIWLRTGRRGQSAVALAHTLMEHFGSIRAVFDATQTELCVFEGIGVTRYVELQASLELARRYTLGRLRRGQAFCNPKDTRDYLLLGLQGRPHEVFSCLFLDSQHRLIRFEDMFRDTIDSAVVHVREVTSRALTLNAAAIIAAHNHPSGIIEPSAADRALTRSLADGLLLLDVRLLYQFIVGDGEATPMASLGLL